MRHQRHRRSSPGSARQSTAVLSGLLFLLATGVAAQTVREVPRQYPTIQAAIRAAADRDVVRVSPGTYVENLDFEGKAIRVESTDGPSYTILDGAQRDSVVVFRTGEGRDAVMTGFTVAGGRATLGGGIYCGLGTGPTIEGNVITGNLAVDGGGLFIYDAASPCVRGNRIERNRATNRGGGLAVMGFFSRTVVVEQNEIRENLASTGGGLFLKASGVVVRTNRIHRNRARQGGGLAADSSQALVHGNTLVSNLAHAESGGLHLVQASAVEIAGNILWANASPWFPEIRVSGAEPYVHHDLIRGGYPKGAGIVDADPRFVDIDRGDFHLRADSPARDRGTSTGAPAHDFEGDPRLSGPHVDLGADEFHPHVYVRDPVIPGQETAVHVMAPPGATVWWTTGAGLLAVPVPIPGLGDWRLVFPVAAPVNAGLVPADGRLTLACRVAAGPGPVSVFGQALVVEPTSMQLTNALHARSEGAPRVLEVPGTYASIQAALDAAQSLDVIRVAPGTYRGLLDFRGKAVRLQSGQGAAVTTLDGNRQGVVVTFDETEGPASVLEGFTITNGYGGVQCLDGAPTLQHNVITRNHNTGVLCHQISSAPLIRNNVISHNYGNAGGGILCGGITCLVNNEITGNDGSEGGGIHCIDTPVFLGNRVHDNRGRNKGGAVYGNTTGAWFVNERIYRNEADRFGGIYLAGGAPVISHVAIYDNNDIQIDDYGLYVTHANAVITNAALYRNYYSCANTAGARSTITYSCFSENPPRSPLPGNIQADPRFVDGPGGDFHLYADSPCVDAGTAVGVSVFSTDPDGDPRPSGAAPDMGADERHATLYHHGEPRAGGSVDVRILGAPGSRVILGIGNGVAVVPLVIPGAGRLHLATPIQLVDLGALASSGFVRWTLSLAGRQAGERIPLQALVGSQLVPVHTIEVK